MVNPEGEGVLVEYHFRPKQGERNLTQAEADKQCDPEYGRRVAEGLGRGQASAAAAD